MKLNDIEKDVVISGKEIKLNGILGVPAHARGLVIFAHGSGSGRLSSRNNYVARQLQKANFATLLMDLLTEVEKKDRRNVFDIELLAERLIMAKKWLFHQSQTQRLSVAYFGASTGAGAALVAAAINPSQLFAVVSRGGRPDLAKTFLSKVIVPTLLMVGGNDDEVIGLNQEAYLKLRCEKELKIIPGASHLFEEPGTLEEVAQLACAWFIEHSPHKISNLFTENQME